MNNSENMHFEKFLILSLLLMVAVQINTVMYKTKNSGRVLQASTTTLNQVRFYYDSGGQRIAKLNPAGVNTYYISPNLEIVYNKDGSTAWRKNYYFSGKAVAVRNGSSSSISPSGPTNTPTPTLSPTPFVPTPTNIPTITNTPTPTPLPPNTPPEITTTGIPRGTAGSGYGADITARDINTYDNLTMTIANLPSGFSVGCSQSVANNYKNITCSISTRSASATSRYITATVSDGKASSSRQFLLSIRRDTAE